MGFPRKTAFLLVSVALWGTSGCGASSDGASQGSSQSQATDAAPPQMTLPEGAQATSFLGEPLFPPVLPEEVLTRREQQLAEALQELEADPQGADALIWAARRYAYLGDYRKAIELFGQGIAEHPDDARFYRHRGHRYISVREIDNAIADFRKAAELIEGTEDEVEPDGQPNAMGIPTSTLHFNIFYHYGLAHFIKGEFEEAEEIYRRCMDASIHADSKVATAHWWYMSLRRSGRVEEAEALIQGLDLGAFSSEIIESGSYMDLLRLYSAATVDPSTEVDPGTMEGAALGYGLGNFYLYNGRTEEARAVFEGLVAARDQWAAFGYIAAEADLARLENR